jgi:hypothetical protein
VALFKKPAALRILSTPPEEPATGAKAKSQRAGVGGAEAVQPKKDACFTCGKTVYVTEKLEADGKIFHKGTCFKCAHCNCVLSLGKYAALQGKYYCKPHFKQVRALLSELSRDADASSQLFGPHPRRCLHSRLALLTHSCSAERKLQRGLWRAGALLFVLVLALTCLSARNSRQNGPLARRATRARVTNEGCVVLGQQYLHLLSHQLAAHRLA